MMEDVSSTLFSVEAPLFITSKLLLLQPGLLFRNYLSGKRKSYYKPITFFILATVIYVVLRSWLDDDPYSNIPVIDGNTDMNIFSEAARFMVKNINNILFVFVIAMAISMKLFFSKKYSFVEFVSISFYLVSIYTLIGSILLIVMALLDVEIKVYGMLLMFAYYVWALISFFQKRKLLTILKIIFSYVIALVFYVFLGFGLSLLIVKLQ